MFSPRLFALFAAVLAISTALPAQSPLSDKPVPRPITTITADDLNDSWFGFPFFSNLFGPIWQLFPSFADVGPRVVADDDKFQVSISVKDYSKGELKVKVKNGLILIHGTHEAKHDQHDLFASQFFHTYSMPANSSSDDVKAELSSDGWLTVTALITGAPVEATKEGEKLIEITETGAPFEPPKEKKPEQTTDLPSTPSVDRKEPTTPAVDREEVTDKDNSIPHGNEVVNI